jgi:SAM-dependent methyltransferase
MQPRHDLPVTGLYTGEAGRQYFIHRRANWAVDVQTYSASLFAARINPSATVLDFGCGTGGILSAIPCQRRIGIELNEDSVRMATQAGIAVHASLHEIGDSSTDVVITHHALEHVLEPQRVIAEFFRILIPNGKLIVVVPCEPGRKRPFRSWQKRLDFHLYSWNPLTLGNLLTVCGFSVTEAFVLSGGYSRYNAWLRRVPPLFLIAERCTAWLLNRFSTVCVATKSSIASPTPHEPGP